jgi:sugar lactone lactonase YvrE
VGGPPGFVPSQFYTFAEQEWQAKLAAASFNAASTQLRQSFHDAAVSGPATAPTITIPPSSVTVSVGDTATFTVTASGTGPLYYQWQKNGVDIPNATFWYYITPPAQTSNNGDQYRVRVTNTQGNPTSSAATLTINGASSGDAPVVSSVSPSSFTGLPIGQTKLIRVIGSGFTGSSTLTFNDGFTSYPGRVPVFVSANELDYNITTGTNQANWKVQVVNGAQTSGYGYFTVNAPSAPPQQYGSLVVSLSPAAAISAGAQWQVDGTGYNSSGQVVGYLTPGSHTVSFKPISGYTTPANQLVTINANAETTAGGTYSVVAPSTYTLTLNQGGAAGYIVNQPFGSGNGSIYNAGAAVQLTANPNFGYHFVNWSGDVSGTANPTTVVMNGNKSVTANFASGDPNLGTITVTIQPPEAVTAGVTWGFNDSDFRASGSSYSYYPETVFAYLHGANGWTGVGGWVTLAAGQTSNYVFTASNTNGSVLGSDPRSYFTFAGSPGISGFTNGARTGALFSGPWSIAIDTSNNFYVADSGNNVIRKIDASGNVSTFAGNPASTGSTDGVGTNALFNHPLGVALDKSNNVYVVDFNNNAIRKITPNGTVSTFAGSAGSSGSNDATGSSARFNGPAAVTVDTNGNVFVADNYNCTIRKITSSGAVSTLAGSPLAYGSVDATGSAARFRYPSGVAVDNSGNVYVADTFNQTIRKVTSGGVVTTLAGFSGSSGAGDGTGSSAFFSYPNGVAVDSAGNVYVADSNNHVIRKITPAGVTTTLAGLSGHFGTNDGVGSIARFRSPDGLAIDSAGNIFIADGGNQTIRATQSLTNKIDQFISFAPLPNKSANDTPFSISATASSGLPVYLNVLSGPGILDTNNMLTLLGGGTVNVIAWQPGNSNYNAAVPVLQSFNVSQIPQTITFGALSQQKVGDAPFSLSATSDSGLPVSFSVSGPAVLDGNILTLTNWGTVTVTASQTGNASYMAATNVVQSFFVVPSDNTIVAPQKLPNGDFQLAFYGLVGSNYLIQASTNLIDWQPFTNFTGTNFLLYFNDSGATNFKQRFYRIRSL